ncbi:hypothetical protein OG992_08745 [Micromonospora sp. NBC_00362]|uniref:hypothetical protein n=1 Tax=Micromonospora sp. NBC_00362 TaxID=2975975 RepID=UPI002256F05E|nr:hypothetical protein [Micromonospora sp. NBC_00362]MCX5117265.1 hypothetical protein [Micromonospora sp. NBC_00362]
MTTAAPAVRAVSAAEELGQLLSTATRIEPELIRAVRLQVAGHLDSSAEADLWFSDLVGGRNPGAISLQPDRLQCLREGLAQRIRESTQQDPIRRVGDIISDLHAHLPPPLRIEESIAWLSVIDPASAADHADRLLHAALRSLIEEKRTGLADWFAGAWDRLPAEARSTSAAWKLTQVVRSQRRLCGDEWVPASDGEVQPSELTIEDVALIAHVLPAVELSAERSADGITIRQGAGDRTLLVPATVPRIVLLNEPGTLPQGPRTVLIPEGGSISVPVGPGPVHISTASSEVIALTGPGAAGLPGTASPQGRIDQVIVAAASPDVGFLHYPTPDGVCIIPATVSDDVLDQGDDVVAVREIITTLRSYAPHRLVIIVTPSEVRQEDLYRHILLVGGSYEEFSAALLHRPAFPVHRSHEGFWVTTTSDGAVTEHRPASVDVENPAGQGDVALIARAPNPWNPARTLIVVSGITGHGTISAIRALTDPLVRERNSGFLDARFEGAEQFAVLVRVDLLDEESVAPDLTRGGTLLYAWSPSDDSQA